jgi:iron complex outermembrane receptor protein
MAAGNTGRRLWLSGVALEVVASSIGPAPAQVALPEIVVTAPSPIVRRAPVAPVVTTIAPPVPAPTPTLQGTLPIVADQFATVTVIPNPEILRTPAATLGDLVFAKPGMTGSSFAPGAASRPVIRGLDNYRVRIQENGLAVNDVSEISDDHAVPIDPLSARQIEVIRGPATLRWGSQAIGGVVNVDNNRIPTTSPCRSNVLSEASGKYPVKAPSIALQPGHCVTGELKGALTSVDKGLEGAVLLDAGNGPFAFHADAFGRRASDYRIPSYPYLFPPDPAPTVNGRQPNSAMRSDGQSVGGSYLFDGGFVGVAVTQFNSFYQIPGIEATETNARIDLAQTKYTGKGEFRPQSSVIDAVRFWLAATDYRHLELANEGGFDGIQQTFTNKAQEGRVEVQLMPFDLRFAALTTAFGVQAERQNLVGAGVTGGLFDPNNTRSVAGYLFNEFRFTGEFRMQTAGRIERVTVKGSSPDLPADFLPDGAELVAIERGPAFTPKSAAIGFLHDLPWGLVASLTAQHVERAPRAPELLSRGPHEASGTFEIGNPNLTIETAHSLEAGLRRAKGPLRFEATAFYTKYSGFIFRQFTGTRCGDDFDSCGVEDELAQVVYDQRDATFRGVEVASQWDVAPHFTGVWGIDGQFDMVRATFSDGTHVPRVPPMRVGGGVYWRDANWFARIGLLHAFPQNDIAENETPTTGYNLLKAELSYTKKLRQTGPGLHEVTVGIVGNNLLDDDVRNHVSFKKDEVLLPGRSARVFVSAKF